MSRGWKKSPMSSIRQRPVDPAGASSQSHSGMAIPERYCGKL
jgi:hypothetical protein